MRALRWIARASIAVVAAAPAGAVARAEDAPPPRRAAEVRAHPVGALLRGHPWFVPDRGPGPVDAADVNDEREPLFGDELEEASLPLGSMTALVARLRATAGTPEAWEGEEVEVSPVGDLLLVRAPRALQEAIDVRLAEWTREVCTTIVVDVALFEGDLEAVRPGDGLAIAVAAGTLRPLGVARVLPPTHGAGTARDGARIGYLADQDTEIGCSCNAADPIVGVVAQGLAVQVVALPSAAGRWRVDVRGFWADDPRFEERRMQGGRFFLPHDVGPRVPVPPGGDLFEAVSVRGEAFDVPLTLEEGVWTTLALSGRRVLAARLRAQRPSLESGLRPAGDLSSAAGAPDGPRPSPAVAGPLTWRSFSIGDLLRPVQSARGGPFRIFPSNYCPAELPPLPEPQAAMTVESLPWVLERTLVPPPSDEEHRPIRLRSQRLAVRTDDAGAAAVERVLAALRATRLRTTEVQASVVTLPLGSLPELWSDPDAAAAGGVAALLARPGARIVETARLVLRDGQRAAVVSSTDRWYLKDYDVELACTTTIGNPVLGRLPTGLSVDVRADPVPSSSLVSLLVRFDRGVLLGMRPISTRYGPIQAPSMHEASCRGAATLAPGETRLFGVSASGPEATLVLLSVAK